jgi:hypothetical protein
MSKSQFRWVLVVYLVFSAASAVTAVVTRSMIPEKITAVERGDPTDLCTTHFGPDLYVPCTVIVRCGVVSVIVAAVVGMIGMFMLWRLGPYIFFAAVGASIFATPILFTWRVDTVWSGVVGDIGTLLEGIIFTLVFFGPAKRLFRGEGNAKVTKADQ